ncbi:MAG: phosphate regulon sensor histidine kinase PhoR [Aeromonas sp.]
MLHPYVWYKQGWKVLGYYALLALAGWLADSLSWVLLLAVSAHLLWHYRFQKMLSDWLWHQRSLVPPHGQGSWEHIFHGIYKLQQRHRARRRELAGFIRRFREGAEALPDAAVVIRNDGSILWCNKLAEQLLGLRWPGDAGQHIGNLIRHPAFSRYLRRGNYDEPIEIPSPINEERQLEFRFMAYAADQAMMVARDVTRLRRLEKTRKHFVSNVSHELRTPLTVLKGYLEMTEGEVPPAHWRQAHQMMQAQTQRMENLVNQLLALSRIEAAPAVDLTQLVDVPSMLTQIQAEAQTLSGERAHVLEFNLQPDLWVRGDAQQLRSAMANLVYNAVHYTPAGKRITVEWRKQGPMALCAVADEGEGIAYEHLSRLTERFYRVDRARGRARDSDGGSGLGLAIVKHALSHHDASLEIDSQLGVGSRFSFLLPAHLVVLRHETVIKTA